jgi:predicted nucleic acid-binding protein
MKSLVLDAGPVIALFSRRDDYHELAKDGFARLPREFGEVLIPLSIVFEVYKFVAFNESFGIAQEMLATLQAETVIEILSQDDFLQIFGLATQYPDWTGTLEDGSVLVVAKRTQSFVWTIDYKDLGFFKNIDFWTP